MTTDIENLCLELSQLKQDVRQFAGPDYLGTVTWMVAVDATIVRTNRWSNENDFSVFKEYAQTTNHGPLFSECLIVHDLMNKCFPNVPDRYNVRLIAMQYLTDPLMNSSQLYTILTNLTHYIEKLNTSEWGT